VYKSVTTLVVRRAVDLLITKSDVAMLTQLISKFDKLDIGTFTSIISPSSESMKIPISIILMGINYQKSLYSLCLLPTQLLNIFETFRAIKLLNLSGNSITLEAATMLSAGISSLIWKCC